jgi:transposase InsO family protein
VLARDAVWGEDTTHLGRAPDGSKVEAEVVRDLATKETVGVAVGGVPTAEDAVALLERTAQERGGWPLVRMADQGSINRDARVVARLDEERVVHLLSRVHTPTDNAATERGHGEIKGEAKLGCGVRLADVQEARERVERARLTLDEGRLRATLGWRTAAQVGRELPRADTLVDRDTMYEEACNAMEQATLGLTQRRAVLHARREALFDTLERFGLARRHVGRRPRVRPGPGPCSAAQAAVECRGAHP